MMPSRSTPNLQQQQQPAAGGGQQHHQHDTNGVVEVYATMRYENCESPPPAPPVRDASTLRAVKYGPGHEKFPSWPVPAAVETPHAVRAPPSGGSHRSKSWTDHTNYPKEKLVAYTRPYMKRQHSSQTQQKLKTVMERCEKIPPETYDRRLMADAPPPPPQAHFYLPHVDRDGKQLGDADYMVPSPPERDTCKPQLTQADLEQYAQLYRQQDGGDGVLMHLHQKQLSSYAHSEGYHSYVSSADSTSTPFLDRLRRDSEAVGGGTTTTTHWGGSNGCGIGVDDNDCCIRREGRDSVVTTSSGSASSSETLKWHGSMSDVSIASSSCTHNGGNKQLIAHSARVQTPQRHHSESILYMSNGGTTPAIDAEGWKNQANKLKLFAVNTYTVQDDSALNNNGNNRANDSALSVADRVNQLEKQKYSYLDPDKKHKVPDPTLKAIQKKALLSFYERHHQPQSNSKTNWRSEPQLTQNLQSVPSATNGGGAQSPPSAQPRGTNPVQLPSRRASSASDYAAANGTGGSVKRGSIPATNQKLGKHQHSSSYGSLTSDLLGPIIMGPSISLDDWVPAADAPPPARPPKNPHLRTAYPDLFRETRVPSPDLPPPPPEETGEEVLINNDEPLPPPPPSSELLDLCDRINEGDHRQQRQRASPQQAKEARKSAREQLGVAITRTPSTKKPGVGIGVGAIATNQKVHNGRQQPMRAEPLFDRKALVKRASFAETSSSSKDAPPPLQPRQMRTNQSMRAKIGGGGGVDHIRHHRPAAVALRISPVKDAQQQQQPQNAKNPSKASYLASRRDRERIVPDSDTGSYKRTLSPSGHDYADHNNTTTSQWSSSSPPSITHHTSYTPKESILKKNHNNNNNNLSRRSSMNDRTMANGERMQDKPPHIILPDVLPINVKLMSPCYISRPTQLSLSPVDADEATEKQPQQQAPSPPTTITDYHRSINDIKHNYHGGVMSRSAFELHALPPDRTVKIAPLPSPPSSPSGDAAAKKSASSSLASSSSPPLHNVIEAKNTKLLECIAEDSLSATVTIRDKSNAPTPSPPPPSLPLPPLVRKKHQEEIDCEKLSEDFVSRLPTSAKLKGILVQGPDFKKPTDYVNGLLFKADVTSRPRPANSPFSRSRANTPSNSPPPAMTTPPSTASHDSSMSSMSSLSESTASLRLDSTASSPLSATSAYFTISEPKARLLTRYSQDMNHLNIAKDTKDLSQKKDELINRLDKKLQVLRGEQLMLSDECRINEELGSNVEAHVARVARPHEASKFRLHVEEVGKITSLLLSLSGRLARAENALLTTTCDDYAERRILETKRDKLLEQLEEAKKLKECIDKRAVCVSSILNKYFDADEYADYDHFINMKAKLLMDSKDIADKIKLGEEQLMALKETLIICATTTSSTT